VILLWTCSPIPTFLIFTAVLHGMLLGLCLMWVVTKVGVHCPVRRTVVGVLAGGVSVVVLAFGQYLVDAYAHQRQTQAAARTLSPVAQAADHDVLTVYDHDVLQPVTGQGGIVGHIRLITRGAAWQGWVRSAEAILVIGVATTLCITARTRSLRDR
jgi:hypothetical protein